jgi:hypothetical protein
VIATDGTPLVDDDPCGFGTVDETPVIQVEHCAVGAD